MKRVQMEPEFTMIGGILRIGKMADVVRAALGREINVPEGDLVQYAAALGAALAGRVRVERLAAAGLPAPTPERRVG
jgi:activator of 2-hydroxyglutaryl-CoA dehydratase